MNNAETFARVPGIVRHGAASFRKLGTSDTPGTLIFTVSGDVARPGVYEREAGMTLSRLFHEIAGGSRNGRPFKAALSGVANRVIPAARFDTPADFGSLQMIGSGLGSAGFVVYDEAAGMPQVAQMVARFLYVESCNQCTACKHGLGTASRALDAYFDPEEPSADLYDRVLAGAEHAPQGNRCYLPVQGAVLIPSILKAFRGEFDEQLEHRRRPSSPLAPPKMTDYDEERHAFTYDPLQPFKNPDWTYSLPEHLEAPAKTSTQAAEPTGPISIRLAPDVAQAMRERRHASGRELDDHVNEALRVWLKQESD
jgi:NADH-quinone oxidoreductase subunit F